MKRSLPHIPVSLALQQVAAGFLLVALFIGAQALADSVDGRIVHARGGGTTIRSEEPEYFKRSLERALQFSGGMLALAGLTFGAGAILKRRERSGS